MSLSERVRALSGEYGRIDLSGCTRDELPALCVSLGFKFGAEVGVYKAAYSEQFAKAGMLWFAVDPWEAFDGQGRTQQRQERQDFLFGHATRVLAPYPNATILRKPSLEAARLFRDGSLDIVYVDGDHTFAAVAADLYAWYPKVKSGGILSGHDYDFLTKPGSTNVICHVGPVVDAFVQAFRIPRYYIFGSQPKCPASFLLVKP